MAYITQHEVGEGRIQPLKERGCHHCRLSDFKCYRGSFFPHHKLLATQTLTILDNICVCHQTITPTKLYIFKYQCIGIQHHQHHQHHITKINERALGLQTNVVLLELLLLYQRFEVIINIVSKENNSSCVIIW